MSATEHDPAEPVAEQPQEEIWAYGGVRTDSGGTKQHAWLPDAGRGPAVYFARLQAHAVGELYRVRVLRDPDRLSVYPPPRYAADGRLAPDVAAQLRAEHQAALTTLTLHRQHRAAARRNELHEALEPWRVIAARLTRPERTALIAWLITELTHPVPGHDRTGGDRR